ncbi:hypothetical protein HYX18_03315 [Candidatus Woesearchaeota archaeon]|nr:hypothetical protein [Candidatus Woesearchaeota archaeon]
MKIRNKKGEIEIDQLVIWILAALVVALLIIIIFRQKENILEFLTNFGNILRFGGG